MSEIENAPPKLFIHCITVFGAMHKKAKYEELNERTVPVYEGFLTKLFQELSLATPYYSTVMRRLQKMGCVKQLSRGGGSAPSRWELITEPEYGLYEDVETEIKQGTSRLTLLERVESLEAELKELRTGTNDG